MKKTLKQTLKRWLERTADLFRELDYSEASWRAYDNYIAARKQMEQAETAERASAPTLEVGTELFAAPQSAFRKNDDDKPLPNAVMERLYQAARAVADNIAEFGTVTDGERIDALDAALNALSDTAPSPKGVSDGVREAFESVDAEDWRRLFLMLPDSGYGSFWKQVLSEIRTALSQERAPGRKES